MITVVVEYHEASRNAKKLTDCVGVWLYGVFIDYTLWDISAHTYTERMNASAQLHT